MIDALLAVVVLAVVAVVVVVVQDQLPTPDLPLVVDHPEVVDWTKHVELPHASLPSNRRAIRSNGWDMGAAWVEEMGGGWRLVCAARHGDPYCGGRVWEWELDGWLVGRGECLVVGMCVFEVHEKP